MFENYEHDPQAKKDEDKLNERPFFMRFGTNQNMMGQWRAQRMEELARKKKEEAEGK